MTTIASVTERIASAKPVTKDNVELVLVTTTTGKTIWVRKNQINDNADLISYIEHKAGSEYVNKDGSKGTRKSDNLEYVGCKQASKFDMLDYMKSIGITPTFSMS